MAEELKLIESIDEARPGVRVRITGCKQCGRTHDGVCLNSFESHWMGRAVEVVPDPHPERGGKWMISERSVRARKDYIYLDGLDDSTATDETVSKPKVLEHARG